MTGIVLFVTLLVFLVLNVPVGIAIGLASLAAITTNPRVNSSACWLTSLPKAATWH